LATNTENQAPRERGTYPRCDQGLPYSKNPERKKATSNDGAKGKRGKTLKERRMNTEKKKENRKENPNEGGQSREQPRLPNEFKSA